MAKRKPKAKRATVAKSRNPRGDRLTPPRYIVASSDALGQKWIVGKLPDARRILSRLAAGSTIHIARGAPGDRPLKLVETKPGVRSNPPSTAGAVCMSKRVYALAYRHAQGAGKNWKHTFDAGVSLYGLPDGSVLLRRADRKPLHATFTVKAGT
jgi:hypothetical protein